MKCADRCVLLELSDSQTPWICALFQIEATLPCHIDMNPQPQHMLVSATTATNVHARTWSRRAVAVGRGHRVERPAAPLLAHQHQGALGGVQRDQVAILQGCCPRQLAAQKPFQLLNDPHQAACSCVTQRSASARTCKAAAHGAAIGRRRDALVRRQVYRHCRGQSSGCWQSTARQIMVPGNILVVDIAMKSFTEGVRGEPTLGMQCEWPRVAKALPAACWRWEAQGPGLGGCARRQSLMGRLRR